MRNVGLLFVAVLFASVIGFSGCAKKEAPPPPPPVEKPMAPADNTMQAPMEKGAPAAPATAPKPMEEKK
jgi:hypothetical protein